MRKLTLLISTTLLALLLLFTPLMAEDRAKSDGPAGAGGPLVGATLLNYSELNTKLVDAGYKKFQGPMVLYGGGGFGSFFADLRLGGVGYGGTKSRQLSEGQAKLSLGFGGGLVEKGVKVTNEVRLKVGFLAGAGSLQLTLPPGSQNPFESSTSSSTTSSISPMLTPIVEKVSLSKTFYGIQPRLGVNVQVLPWMAFQANAGYLWGFTENWKNDDKLYAGPPNQIRQPLLMLGVSFGYFG